MTVDNVKDSTLIEKTDDDSDGGKGRTIISLFNGDDIRVRGNWFDEISETIARGDKDNAFIVIENNKVKRKIFVRYIVTYYFTESSFHTVGEEIKNASFSSHDGFTESK